MNHAIRLLLALTAAVACVACSKVKLMSNPDWPTIREVIHDDYPNVEQLPTTTLAAGDSEHGATVHFVTEELDGGPPVLQARVPVLAGDDEDSLSARVHRAEHKIFPVVVNWFCGGRLTYRDGRAWFDGGQHRRLRDYRAPRPCRRTPGWRPGHADARRC